MAMKRFVHQVRPSAGAALAALLLAACGGGGGGSSSPTPVAPIPTPPTTSQVSGTSAQGAALAKAAISAKCADGSVTTATAGDDGAFSLTISGAPYPCLFQAAVGAVKYHSIAIQAGTVNVTPFTELLVARMLKRVPVDAFGDAVSTWAGLATSAAVNQAQAEIRTVLASYPDAVNSFSDFITMPFKAASSTAPGDAADKSLDSFGASLANKHIALADVSARLAASQTPAAVASILSSGTYSSVAALRQR